MSSTASWRARELLEDGRWIFSIGPQGRRDLVEAVRAAPVREHLLEYRKADFDLGEAGTVLRQALEQVTRGRGVAMIRGLPREELGEQEFGLLTWAFGLQVGVARPQGKATPYMTAVRDEGSVYRSGKGRGYSSNAELDYHTDSADLVFLSCYNRAESGGMSLTTSTLAAYDEMQRRHPGLVRWLHEPLHFSRQGEEAPDEGTTCLQPVYAAAEGQLVCRWNWNRVNSAQMLPGVPKLGAEHRQALEKFDRVVRDADLVHDFWMEPGDLQIISSHRTLHSRTEFVDHPDAARKRLMYRLWIAPPGSPALPPAWADLYRHVEAGSRCAAVSAASPTTADARTTSVDRRRIPECVSLASGSSTHRRLVTPSGLATTTRIAVAEVKQAAQVVDLLEYFSDRGQPATLAEICRQLDWPKSSAFKLLATLTGRGYLYEPHGRGLHYPSPKWRTVVAIIERNEPTPPALLDLLHDVAARTGETAVLASISGNNAHFMEAVESRNPVRYTAKSGKTVPLHLSAVGRALIAQLSDVQRAALLARTEFKSYTAASAMNASGRRAGNRRTHGVRAWLFSKAAASSTKTSAESPCRCTCRIVHWP